MISKRELQERFEQQLDTDPLLQQNLAERAKLKVLCQKTLNSTEEHYLTISEQYELMICFVEQVQTLFSGSLEKKKIHLCTEYPQDCEQNKILVQNLLQPDIRNYRHHHDKGMGAFLSVVQNQDTYPGEAVISAELNSKVHNLLLSPRL